MNELTLQIDKEIVIIHACNIGKVNNHKFHPKIRQTRCHALFLHESKMIKKIPIQKRISENEKDYGIGECCLQLNNQGKV